MLRAIETATGDVLALLDDDPEAHNDWKKISMHYADPLVGMLAVVTKNHLNGEDLYPEGCEVRVGIGNGKAICNKSIKYKK